MTCALVYLISGDSGRCTESISIPSPSTQSTKSTEKSASPLPRLKRRIDLFEYGRVVFLGCFTSGSNRSAVSDRINFPRQLANLIFPFSCETRERMLSNQCMKQANKFPHRRPGETAGSHANDLSRAVNLLVEEKPAVEIRGSLQNRCFERSVLF
jgi:hypothetical protein